MDKELRQYLRHLRERLGTAIMRATDQVEPHLEALERGLRWEDDEAVKVLLAADALGPVAEQTRAGVRSILDSDAVLTKAEKAELVSGRKYLDKGVEILGKIEGRRMFRLLDESFDKNLPLDKGHEVYFLSLFQAAVRVLRLGWYALYQASQKPRPTRREMTRKEHVHYYDPASKAQEKLHAELQAIAAETRELAELYDADGDLVFVASPTAKGEKKTPAKQASAPLTLRPLTRAQAEDVAAILSARPGIGVREAAALAGVEVNEEAALTANLDHAADASMLRRLWSIGY